MTHSRIRDISRRQVITTRWLALRDGIRDRRGWRPVAIVVQGSVDWQQRGHRRYSHLNENEAEAGMLSDVINVVSSADDGDAVVMPVISRSCLLAACLLAVVQFALVAPPAGGNFDSTRRASAKKKADAMESTTSSVLIITHHAARYSRHDP